MWTVSFWKSVFVFLLLKFIGDKVRGIKRIWRFDWNFLSTFGSYFRIFDLAFRVKNFAQVILNFLEKDFFLVLLLLKCIYYSWTFHNHIVSACVNIGPGVNISCDRCFYIALNNAFNNGHVFLLFLCRTETFRKCIDWNLSRFNIYYSGIGAIWIVQIQKLVLLSGVCTNWSFCFSVGWNRQKITK